MSTSNYTSASEYLYENEDTYRRATDKRIAENKAKGNRKRFENQELLAWLEGNVHNSFYKSLYESIGRYGKLTDKQMACAMKGFNEYKYRAEKAKAREEELKALKADCSHAMVSKGGKSGAIVIHNGKEIKTRINNARKGDIILCYFKDGEVVHTDSYISRYNVMTRTNYDFKARFNEEV